MRSGLRMQAFCSDGGVPSLDQVVFGIHWSPSASHADAADLDAVCVMRGAQDQALETIHGGRPRNANDSVVHTGDSRSGANLWDDERIFVFTKAVPREVLRLAFLVVCVTERAFHQVPGATCHVTDHASGHEWLRVDLSALRGKRSYTAATLERTSRDWLLVPGGEGRGRRARAGSRRSA